MALGRFSVKFGSCKLPSERGSQWAAICLHWLEWSDKQKTEQVRRPYYCMAIIFIDIMIRDCLKTKSQSAEQMSSAVSNTSSDPMLILLCLNAQVYTKSIYMINTPLLVYYSFYIAPVNQNKITLSLSQLVPAKMPTWSTGMWVSLFSISGIKALTWTQREPQRDPHMTCTLQETWFLCADRIHSDRCRVPHRNVQR